MGKFKHYFIVAWRSLRKNKVSFSLSFLGLALAFSLCIISSFLLWSAYSSDAHWEKSDRIYQFTLEYEFNDAPYSGSIAMGLADDLRSLSNQIETVITLAFEKGDRIREGKRQTIYGTVVDGGFLNIFDLKEIHGDLKSTLSTVNVVALSQEKANEYYGYDNPVGEIFELHSSSDGPIEMFTVGAIYKNPPSNSVWVGREFIIKRNPVYDAKTFNQSYVLVKEGTDIETLQRRISKIADEKYPKPESATKVSYQFRDLSGWQMSFLSGKYENTQLTSLFMASLFMLFIAVFNYISLSAAMAASRGKDVALRKIMGASSSNLTLQYLVESLILVSFSYLCALALAEVLAAPISDFTGEEYSIYTFEHLPHLFLGWGGALLIGVIASIYPIWSLVYGKATILLQNAQRGIARGGAKLRSILITLQAMCGLGLAFAASVIYSQATFQESADKGIDVNNLLYITFDIRSDPDYPSPQPMINGFMRLDGVKEVGRNSWSLPFKNMLGNMTIAHPETNEPVTTRYTRYGEGFFTSLGVITIAGRLPAPPQDSGNTNNIIRSDDLVVNQSYVKHFNLGTPVEAVGKCIFRLTLEHQKRDKCYEIKAVVADFHFSVGEKPIEPTAFMPLVGYVNTLIVRFDNYTDIKTLLPQMKEIWDNHFPERAFKYDFVDDLIHEEFRMIRGMGIMLLITGFAIFFLTVAGLYAMAKFVVVRRGREIAIRRVLGATSYDIVRLIVVQLAKPIILGAFIGLPVGWYYAMDWLMAYSVRIEPEPWYAILLGVVGVIFFILTATSEILRAVRIRPAEALHYE